MTVDGTLDGKPIHGQAWAELQPVNLLWAAPRPRLRDRSPRVVGVSVRRTSSMQISSMQTSSMQTSRIGTQLTEEGLAIAHGRSRLGFSACSLNGRAQMWRAEPHARDHAIYIARVLVIS